MKNIKINFEKLESLGYDHIEIQTCSGCSDILISSYNNKEIDLEDDLIGFFSYILVEIYATNFDTDKKEKVGYLEGYYFPQRVFVDENFGVHESFLSIADEIGGDLFDCVESLCDKNYEDFDPQIATAADNVFYISEFQIYPKFQNLGIASFIIKNLYKILISKANLSYLSTFTVFPSPFLLDEEKTPKEKFNEETKRLILFYKRLGFKKYKNTSYYYLNTKDKDTFYMED